MISRRTFLAQTAGLAAGFAAGRSWALAGPVVAAPLVTIYKSPTCGCCAKWVDHVKAAGFQTVVHDRENMEEVKDWLGVPKDVRSCHTAQVDRYLLEGHVPASDVQRLLRERPKLMGLAVPGMPASAPGMDEPGKPHEAYEVLAFQSSGATQSFAKH